VLPRREHNLVTSDVLVGGAIHICRLTQRPLLLS
jgi:hypothetical protein